MKEVHGIGNRPPQPVFSDRKTVDEESLWQKGNAVVDAKRRHFAETRRYQEEATINFLENAPITVVGIGDVHMGSIYSDINLFERDMNIINSTPGMYAVFLSNLIDTAMPAQFPDSMLANGLTAGQQAEAMNAYIRELDKQKKVLGMVRSPCHEGWTEKRAGIDIQQIIFMGTEIPRLENGGTLVLSFPNDEQFRLALYHQFGKGYGSDNNKNYASWYQERQVRRGIPDAIMVAHSHVAEVEHSYYGQPPNRKKVVMVRTGSYKGNVSGELNAPNDVWQRDQSGKDGEPSGTAITFFPEHQDMQPHLSPIEAAQYQLAQRAYYLIDNEQMTGTVRREARRIRKAAGMPNPDEHPVFVRKKAA